MATLSWSHNTELVLLDIQWLLSDSEFCLKSQNACDTQTDAVLWRSLGIFNPTALKQAALRTGTSVYLTDVLCGSLTF